MIGRHLVCAFLTLFAMCYVIGCSGSSAPVPTAAPAERHIEGRLIP